MTARGTTSNNTSHIRAAVMGAGRWGCNLVRVLDADPSVRLTWVIDPNPKALERAQCIAPSAKMGSTIAPALSDVDAVAVCTPARDHVRHVRELLAHQKDVFVEKPIALRTCDAEALRAACQQMGAVLMVGHQLLYHPAFTALESAISAGHVGPVRTIRAERTGALDFSREPGVLWSFGPHDVAMILQLAQEMPCHVSATGILVKDDPAMVASADIGLVFPSGMTAKIHLAASRTRRRRLTIFGDQGVAVFDDTHPGGQLSVRRRPPAASNCNHPIDLAVQTLGVPKGEPLALESAHFAACVSSRSEPRTGSEHAVRVTQVLEAAAASLLETTATQSFAV
ncbi:MAG: Gfo/Idh/MocA family oxidoreductase [Myxococcota bacterium]|nr:Gfo/Idh/MocA family oxidoreductase [Myxococcota bacterium]